MLNLEHTSNEISLLLETEEGDFVREVIPVATKERAGLMSFLNLNAIEVAQESADQGVLDASAAWAHAEVARVSAAGAQINAVLAQETADEAILNAATAQGVADSASAQAAEAEQNSLDAEDLADAANLNAQGAATTASNAVLIAETAEGVADNAELIAGNAVTTANTADQVADNAKLIADTAIGVANTAEQVADGAELIANNAEGVANTAQGVADNAVGLANTAQLAADTAQLAADNADEIADNSLAIANLANDGAQYGGAYFKDRYWQMNQDAFNSVVGSSRISVPSLSAIQAVMGTVNTARIDGNNGEYLDLGYGLGQGLVLDGGNVQLGVVGGNYISNYTSFETGGYLQFQTGSQLDVDSGTFRFNPYATYVTGGGFTDNIFYVSGGAIASWLRTAVRTVMTNAGYPPLS